MTTRDSLSGTADAPLEATRRYVFRRIVGAAGDAHLLIPIVHRTSCEDAGEVELPEQEAFLEHLLSGLGVAYRTGAPGEWVLADAATLDTVWNALRSALREPRETR